jgi:predicted nucleotidyltransferase component of viral defense system
MDTKLRQAQWQILDIFSKTPGDFALAGGTALELFYLQHRFSRDLDFFSSRFDLREIVTINKAITQSYRHAPILENEMHAGGRAQVQFFSLPVTGSTGSLKIDFAEDNLPPKPSIRRIKKIPVYDVEKIYSMKLFAIAGSRLLQDETVRAISSGRNEVRDACDVYYLSKTIKPLRVFLRETPKLQQRGIISWYRHFSRQEFKLNYLELDLYDQGANSREVIRHLEGEIQAFIAEVLK